VILNTPFCEVPGAILSSVLSGDNVKPFGFVDAKAELFRDIKKHMDINTTAKIARWPRKTLYNFMINISIPTTDGGRY